MAELPSCVGDDEVCLIRGRAVDRAVPFLSVVTWDQCCHCVFAKTKYFHIAEPSFPLIRWLFPCL